MSRRSPCWNYGDINGDGFVTYDDAYLVAQHVIGSITLTPEQLRRADVDGDGVIDIFCALFIAQYVYGVRETFGVCSLLPANEPYPMTKLEVRDDAGALLGILEKADKIGYEKMVNSLSFLTFELPSDDSKLPLLTIGNELWLYGRDLLVDCYKLRKNYSMRADALKERMEADQIGSIMMNDIISSYEATLADEKTATDILTELLAYQTGANPVTLGGVDAALDNFTALKISFINVWRACELLKDAVGGILYVKCDPRVPLTRTLWLMETIGYDEGQQIRVDKNLEGIVRETDYTSLVTKLYPIGKSGLVLSSALVSREAALGSSDATYGYLRLGGQYNCYKNFTGVGNALPAGMVVEESGYGWLLPTGFVDPDSAWNNETKAYDGAIVWEWSEMAWSQVVPLAWGSFLELTHAAVSCTGVRFAIYNTVGAPRQIDVDLYYDDGGGAAWHHLYQGSPGGGMGWVTLTFASQNIEAVRIRYYHETYYPENFGIAECQFFGAGGFVDESVNWVQGADERTIRCAVINYSPAKSYVITYFPTDYLYAWDAVGTYGVIGKAKSYPNISSRDMLIMVGRVDLTELKAPRIAYSINMVDLDSRLGSPFEKLELGNKVHLIDSGLGIDADVHVVRLKKPDMARPELIELDIANKLQDLTDILTPLQSAWLEM